MSTRLIWASVAGAALFAGVAGAGVAAAAVAAPGIASASTRPHVFSPYQQQQLEQQLASRVGQLQRLTADVKGSTTISATDANVLDARIATETASIDGLVNKVPTDTTAAELNADRSAMLRDNRIFAVETPQVFQVIEADRIAAQVMSFRTSESTLESTVSSLSGQPGYKNAASHYGALVASVNRAATASTHVATTVLAQIPQDFHRDTHVFVTANHQLLNADIALAHASYDESILGLASGGYTGS